MSIHQSARCQDQSIYRHGTPLNERASEPEESRAFPGGRRRRGGQGSWTTFRAHIHSTLQGRIESALSLWIARIFHREFISYVSLTLVYIFAISL